MDRYIEKCIQTKRFPISINKSHIVMLFDNFNWQKSEKNNKSFM